MQTAKIHSRQEPRRAFIEVTVISMDGFRRRIGSVVGPRLHFHRS